MSPREEALFLRINFLPYGHIPPSAKFYAAGSLMKPEAVIF